MYYADSFSSFGVGKYSWELMCETSCGTESWAQGVGGTGGAGAGLLAEILYQAYTQCAAQASNMYAVYSFQAPIA